MVLLFDCQLTSPETNSLQPQSSAANVLEGVESAPAPARGEKFQGKSSDTLKGWKLFKRRVKEDNEKKVSKTFNYVVQAAKVHARRKQRYRQAKLPIPKPTNDNGFILSILITRIFSKTNS